MKKKVLALVLCLAMVLSVLPMSVFAAENESITYIDRSWNGEKVAKTEKECADYIVVDANTTTFVDGNWYVVNGEVTVSGRIVVSGTANLILCDGCTLNANSGIQLFGGNALNIYGQSADSGKLNAKASYLGNSGIGGNQNDGNGGDLTVYGGSIYASGRSNAAGIGGGWLTSGGSFTMYGGSVESKGQNAAGIGKGFGGSDGSFTVYGTPHVYAGDTAPDIETTVAGYESSRNSYVKIIYSNHVHTWLDATCTEPKTCSECGEKIGSPLGHTWVKGDMVSEATCTQPAVYRYECSLCHETKNDVYGGKTAHNFVDNVCTECRTNEFVIDESGCLTGYIGYGGDVVIPEGVTSIGDDAFGACESLTEVTIPESVTSIGYSAFGGCSNLTEVTIPESVTSIGESAFGACINLRTVTISDNIQSVGEHAFPPIIRTVNYPCGDDLDIIKAYFDYGVSIGATYNAFHVYSAQGTLVSAATCTHPAVYEAKCRGCDLVQGTMEVGELGHTWQDASCTTPKTCSVCGETEGEALGHTWQDANCTTPKTCSVCGETEGEALGHTWVDANCTTPKTCSVCGETEGEALGHAYELNSKGKATCKRCSDVLPAPKDSENLNSSAINVGDIIKSGTVITPDDNRSESFMGVFVDGKNVGVYTPYKKYTAPTCLKCVSKSTVDRYGNYEIYFETACPYSEATCTEPSTCLYCGHTKGEALGHTWQDANCTTPKTCSVCGETEGEALGHTWQDATCTTPKTCSACGITEGEALGHTWQDANCTTPKTCSVCGETEGEALGHTLTAATCTEAPFCLVCHEYVGEPLGHTWQDANCTTPKTCSVCGETEGEALGHEYVDHEAKAPTCLEIGWDAYQTCSRCDYSTYSEIPALGHSYIWTYNNDATKDTDGTETQLCHCGKTGETRIAEGTRFNCNAVISVSDGSTLDWRTKTTIVATATGVSEGYHLEMTIGDKTYKGSRTEVKSDETEIKGDITYSVKIVEDSTGNEQEAFTKQAVVKVNAGFFKKLIAFFKGLFNLLPKVEVKP